MGLATLKRGEKKVVTDPEMRCKNHWISDCLTDHALNIVSCTLRCF